MRLFCHCGLGVQILGLILAQIAAVIDWLVGILLALLGRSLLETLQVIPRYLPISFHYGGLIIFIFLQGQIAAPLTLITFFSIFFVFTTTVFLTQATIIVYFFISENVHASCELACTAHQLSQIFDALLGAI